MGIRQWFSKAGKKGFIQSCKKRLADRRARKKREEGPELEREIDIAMQRTPLVSAPVVDTNTSRDTDPTIDDDWFVPIAPRT